MSKTRAIISHTLLLLVLLLANGSLVRAAPDLTIEPLTWNIIGLDSNAPASGPRFFPVGAQVCSVGGASAEPLVVTLTWADSNETYIHLRPATTNQITFPDGLDADECVDAYFEV